MPRLDIASGPVLDGILAGTHPIWNDGLTFENYARWNALQLRTDWGRAHLARVAIVDNGRALASAKRYDLSCRLGGEVVRVLGIGAVFTPPDQRGRGHAAALIEAMCAEAERQGYAAALLFSEIGASFYERLGFTPVPRETSTIGVIQKAGAPATLVRSGDDRDLAEIVAACVRISDAAPAFAPVYSEALLQFAIAKRRFLAALDRPGRRVVEFFVSEEGHRPVSFVFLSHGPDGTWLEDCGDRDPSGARVGAMLQVLLARTPAEPPPAIRAWLPAGWLPPQARIESREPAADVMMLKALGGTKLPALSAAGVVWPRALVF